MKSLFTTSILLFLLSAICYAADSDQGFIYGKITTESGKTYEGVIRWGDEEAFWDDMFNSTKADNSLHQLLSDDDFDALENTMDRRLWREYRKARSSWGSWRSDASHHQFKCRFGDIQSMQISGDEDAIITFKNGSEIEVSGGSNDVGAKIRIMDAEIGEVQLRWNRIERIDFMNTPTDIVRTFGAPLYGTVKSRKGEYSGFIQWDHDECLSTDILDGESEDGELDIEFGNITAIEKHRRGANVTLQSGREIYMFDSNDVDSDNRGIVVKDPRFGKVLIAWRDFESISFENNRGLSGPSYRQFKTPERIHGDVTLEDGKTITGKIIYDLDEAWDLEMLDSNYGRTQFSLSFRDIREIKPDGRHGSMVTLSSGEVIELEDSRDIDSDNNGLVIEQASGEPIYIQWRDIEKINLASR